VKRDSGAAGAATSSGDPFLLLGDGGRRPFDATALERELRALWKAPQGGKAPPEGKASPEGTAFYRAALANLIVPLATQDFDRLSAVCGEVSRRYPARVFRIQRADEGDAGAVGGAGLPGAGAARLLARATALCHLLEGGEGGGGFVCSEQILLGWTDASAPLLPSAVRSLLIGDLPVILLALSPRPEPPWMEALAGKADLVIADSGVETEPSAMTAVWERTGRHGTPMRDLAWARLEPWRSLLAELFDAPEASAAIGSIRDLTITYGGAAPPSGAWLLAAWMASRLGWRLASRDGTLWRFRRNASTVDVTLARDEEERAPVLRAVQVRAAGAHALNLRIEHRERDQTARVEQVAPRHSVREFPFAHRDLARVIVGEIQRQEPNPTFHEAASLARAMIAA